MLIRYVPDAGQIRRIRTGDAIKAIHHHDFLREFLPEVEMHSPSASPDGGSAATPDEADLRRTLSRGQRGAGTSIERAFRLFDLNDCGEIDVRLLPHVLHAALDIDGDPDAIVEATREFQTSEGSGVVDIAGTSRMGALCLARDSCISVDV